MNVRSDVAVSAQQYFPTYQIPDESEIALKEYDLSAQGLAADQHGISVAAGLLVILAGGITTILGSENGGSFISALVFQASKQTEFLSYLAVFGLSIVAVRYLVELQKSATHGARKIIILRRLLGIDYGHIEKVLPSDRLEGANEPFAIAMFPGWGSTVSMAAVTVAAVSSYMMYGLAVGFVASRQSFSHYFVYSLEIKSMVFSTSLGIANFALMIIIYRRSLFEEWETHRFHLAKLLGNIMRLRLKRRMGHVLYRLELSVFEAKRLGINLGAFEKILVRIEDRRFYLHRGNSVSDAAKALVRKVKFKARGGGSTIPQQLCRSNFLSKIRRDFRRKILEWMLAPWISERYTKKEILELYLCSVRFAAGVEGVPAALRYYFQVNLSSRSPWNPSKAQVFFLIERLSNISRSIPIQRIKALAADALGAGLLTAQDILELEEIYTEQISVGNLIDPGMKVRLA